MWFVSEEDEQRLAHALLASLLAHVLVLGYVKGVEPLRKAGLGGALNVSFRTSSATELMRAPESPPPTEVSAASAMALVQARTPAPSLAAPKPKLALKPTAAAEGLAGRARAASAKGPGIVEAVLIIGADGHPQGIYWTALPALTTAQFEQLEALIRRQVYASSTGARLTQEIDVFGLLGLGRQRPPPAGETVP